VPHKDHDHPSVVGAMRADHHRLPSNIREFGSVHDAVAHVSMFAIASVAVDVIPNDKTDQLVCRLTMRSKRTQVIVDLICRKSVPVVV